MRLWVHETMRVFGDRLVDESDRMWMLTQMRTQVKNVFQGNFDEVFKHLDLNQDGKVDTVDEVRALFFGDVLSTAASPKRPYTECPDFHILQKQVETHVQAYNEMSSKPMDLVCFLYMLEHLSRVARIVKSPGGNALLVGVGGTGRHLHIAYMCPAVQVPNYTYNTRSHFN